MGQIPPVQPNEKDCVKLYVVCGKGGGYMLRPTAVAVEPMKNYLLRVRFDNGEEKNFDVKPYDRRLDLGAGEIPPLFVLGKFLVVRWIKMLDRIW